LHCGVVTIARSYSATDSRSIQANLQ